MQVQSFLFYLHFVIRPYNEIDKTKNNSFIFKYNFIYCSFLKEKIQKSVYLVSYIFHLNYLIIKTYTITFGLPNE
ncbi:hypothetical protein SAMN05421780_101310 [Flexibacter flexilis DSM 6793]|uniref:Uncharacterized protein n=1 Tax=Flexibacter flexilis DSM 6793 TaxID=927664 RepID=A0A1I1DN42_9BACT|nr:hypothetical protein SAMN05421780_101310 [Flexibacter flexilis DSM 6793]